MTSTNYIKSAPNEETLMKRMLWLPIILTGCTGDIAGVWLMTMEAIDTAECGTTLSHTYRDAEVIDEGGSLASDDELSMTDSISFVQIIEKRSGDAVMVVGEDAYPGTRKDNGTWRFSWDASTEERSEYNDDFDYRFESWDRQENIVTVRINQNGWGTGRGKVDSEISTVRGWLESDSWSVDDSETFSQTPSETYLEDPDGWAIRNNADTDDCDGNCELEVRYTCGTSTKFSVERLNSVDGEDYTNLSEAGQAQGAGL